MLLRAGADANVQSAPASDEYTSGQWGKLNAEGEMEVLRAGMSSRRCARRLVVQDTRSDQPLMGTGLDVTPLHLALDTEEPRARRGGAAKRRRSRAAAVSRSRARRWSSCCSRTAPTQTCATSRAGPRCTWRSTSRRSGSASTSRAVREAACARRTTLPSAWPGRERLANASSTNSHQTLGADPSLGSSEIGMANGCIHAAAAASEAAPAVQQPLQRRGMTRQLADDSGGGRAVAAAARRVSLGAGQGRLDAARHRCAGGIRGRRRAAAARRRMNMDVLRSPRAVNDSGGGELCSWPPSPLATKGHSLHAPRSCRRGRGVARRRRGPRRRVSVGQERARAGDRPTTRRQRLLGAFPEASRKPCCRRPSTRRRR